MPTLMERRDELLRKANDLIAERKAADTELTDDDRSALTAYKAEIDEVNDRINRANQDEKVLAAFEKFSPGSADPSDGGVSDGEQPKNVGEHFVKHGGDRLAEVKGVRGASVSVPEFKAPEDLHQITGWTDGVPYLTDYDRTVVQAFRPPVTVASLLGSGTISGNAISYLVEGLRDGGFANIGEGALKPQMSYANPTAVVDALKKIAGYIKLTDEFIEDTPFLVSEINNRLLYDLAWYEEQQLLAGDGTAQNVLGLLGRDGVQTETAADTGDNPDAVFRAITKIATASGLAADGIVINPLDYQAFRLTRDNNNQYMGGGFFAGQYGQGGIPENPPLWGLRTVVTPAITAGTVLVGAYRQAATLYRKGGVRVESTNSHDADFTSNLVTIRAEERVALAVRRPLGFVKLTLAGATPPPDPDDP